MSPLISGRFRELSAAQSQVLVDTALALEREAMTGIKRLPLKGRNIGLLCETSGGADAALFARAAGTLGARVARIRANMADFCNDETVSKTAQMLSRLYDAVECQGLPASLVEQLRKEASVPIYDALASLAHPSAMLATSSNNGPVTTESRLYTIQAILLATIGAG